MAVLAPPEAWLSEDRRTVHMRRGGWSGDFPVRDLRSRLMFYRSLRDRANGRYAHIYQPTVDALERIAVELRRQQ